MQAERSHFCQRRPRQRHHRPDGERYFLTIWPNSEAMVSIRATLLVMLYWLFQTAWLKTHYPAAYFAAAMSHETLTNSVRSIRMADELKKREIRLLPPSVQHSKAFFFRSRTPAPFVLGWEPFAV